MFLFGVSKETAFQKSAFARKSGKAKKALFKAKKRFFEKRFKARSEKALFRAKALFSLFRAKALLEDVPAHKKENRISERLRWWRNRV